MNLAKYPRVTLGHLPTPLEPLHRLSEELGGPRIWIKRDDCTGLATGGNKTRKLEFLMGEALELGADTILTQGATQSNHARQTAAAAARLGLTCHLLLEDRTGSDNADYNFNGNVLLDQLVGASISTRPGGSDMQKEMEELADRLKADGKRPYIIPGGGSNPVGALGYVNAAMELAYQANCMNLDIANIVHATGSTGTQGGLLAGLSMINSDIEVLGISVKAPKQVQEENVFDMARRTCDYMGIGDIVEREDVVVNSDYVGGGYGVPTDSMVEAVTMLARLEGILLDPVYSGKGMAGMIDQVRKGAFDADSNIVFIHTGGAAALSAYVDAFNLPGYVDM